jgi:hypothetical protein
MAIPALFALKNERALPLKRRCATQKLFRDRSTAPSIHVRAPRSELSKTSESPQRYRNQEDGQDRDRASPPALFPLAGNERQEQQRDDRDDRANEERGRLHRGRQERQ